jgi:rRNA processing protein Gar1
MVYRALQKDVPMFNTAVSQSKDNTNPIGKIDEILGPIHHFVFTVTPFPGVNPADVRPGSKIYIDKAFMLPIVIFTNPQKPTGPRRIGGGVGGRGGPGGPRGGPGGRSFGGPGGQQRGGNFQGGNYQGGNFQGGNFQGGNRGFAPRQGNQNWNRNGANNR